MRNILLVALFATVISQNVRAEIGCDQAYGAAFNQEAVAGFQKNIATEIRNEFRAIYAQQGIHLKDSDIKLSANSLSNFTKRMFDQKEKTYLDLFQLDVAHKVQVTSGGKTASFTGHVFSRLAPNALAEGSLHPTPIYNPIGEQIGSECRYSVWRYEFYFEYFRSSTGQLVLSSSLVFPARMIRQSMLSTESGEIQDARSLGSLSRDSGTVSARSLNDYLIENLSVRTGSYFNREIDGRPIESTCSIELKDDGHLGKFFYVYFYSGPYPTTRGSYVGYGLWILDGSFDPKSAVLKATDANGETNYSIQFDKRTMKTIEFVSRWPPSQGKQNRCVLKPGV